MHIQFLLKFGDQENIEKLLSRGEIFMNSIKWFSEYDKKVVGDKSEGVTKIKNFKNSEFTVNLPNRSKHLTSAKFQYRENLEQSFGNINSTYAISELLLERKKTYRINNRMLNFGSHCLLIENPKNYSNLIFSKLSDSKIIFSQGLVTYLNYYKNDLKTNLFNKSHRLSYQKEHRIIAWTLKKEPLKFEIGTLKSIAEIYETKKIIEIMTVKKNENAT